MSLVENENKKGRTGSTCSFDDGAGEDLDPRVKNELEKLNAATDGINHLETELNEAQILFRQMMDDATDQLKIMHQKLGKCVDKSRPYYEALKSAKTARSELHDASLEYEIAQTKHFNAKRRVIEVERKASEAIDGRLDPSLQELMNQVTTEVMDTAFGYDEAEKKHRTINENFNEKHISLQDIYDKLKTQVAKSRPYFELKSNLNKKLEVQKQIVDKIHEGIHLSKQAYAQTLNELQVISDDIHRTRTLKRQSEHNTGEVTPDESRKNELNMGRNISLDDTSEISIDYDTKSVDSVGSDEVWDSRLAVDDTRSMTSSRDIEYNLLLTNASMDNNDKLYERENISTHEKSKGEESNKPGESVSSRHNSYPNEKELNETNKENNQLHDKHDINVVIKVNDTLKEMQAGNPTSPFTCISSHSVEYSLSAGFEKDIIDGKGKNYFRRRSFNDLLKESLTSIACTSGVLSRDRCASLPNIADKRFLGVDKITF